MYCVRPARNRPRNSGLPNCVSRNLVTSHHNVVDLEQCVVVLAVRRLQGPTTREVAMSKRVADVLVETLHAAGVKRCYGIVGDTLNRIAHAIHESEIEWVHMRHEEASAFAANAEALLTNTLTACAGSCGPGSLHF